MAVALAGRKRSKPCKLPGECIQRCHLTVLQGLREHSVVLMGKNTMMKRCVRLYCERTGNDKWAPLLDALVGNVGLIFTKGELSSVRDEIDRYKVGAPARVGLVAPNDVFVPAGGTGLDPSQTSFFQVPCLLQARCDMEASRVVQAEICSLREAIQGHAMRNCNLGKGA